ncbi:poly(hydroxyalkanoate) granule-associated protein [Rhizobium brockwellii]|uniref:poly(hydroxyalkanoate) granule-associated protein n=1 Tax=Rhizobium TaxID=379 RepID=UPI00102F8F5F|nr:poly(hydroxyalkanoate) granule-associated protein [Rhizobium leguminosarum]QIO53747.1 poly(hydroxyalkanoate) granule-associated protein [Rhizobium leguminosarum bv. trifolii]TAV76273.1 poly(hydroxyalkanoate) granule-associated protein [Rhizobium leguminosarum]TAV80872.1 poly(hydroxyalkanoate) granule-associated protein [Rhizobium leguminosarum]TAX37113.1 poly(hydroxyalkanoate) granule-associated protein [Rhizobium leguminosarum]TAY90530.1 poly(hydroxyalkanoate) granule-associated protein [R
MIRYATSAVSNTEPPKARQMSAATPAKEMSATKPVIEVASADTVHAAYPLLPSANADELGSDTLPKTTKPARRAATKRKPKVAEADDAPLQLNLEA